MRREGLSPADAGSFLWRPWVPRLKPGSTFWSRLRRQGCAAMFVLLPALMTFGSSEPALTYVVLGDSTAAAVGTDYASGIAVRTATELAARRTVTMVNLGVSGARMRDVREKQLPAAVALRPDVVLLSAGANDVTHLTTIRSMRADLRAIVRGLTAANPGVRIVITGSPDMGSPPRIPRLLRGIATCRTRQVNRMFRAEAETDGLLFAEIAEKTGPQFRRDHSLFAADRFHPNDRGYATWLPVLNEALAEATR
jgi:lysophospholipase L1-like esterase